MRTFEKTNINKPIEPNDILFCKYVVYDYNTTKNCNIIRHIGNVKVKTLSKIDESLITVIGQIIPAKGEPMKEIIIDVRRDLLFVDTNQTVDITDGVEVEYNGMRAFILEIIEYNAAYIMVKHSPYNSYIKLRVMISNLRATNSSKDILPKEYVKIADNIYLSSETINIKLIKDTKYIAKLPIITDAIVCIKHLNNFKFGKLTIKISDFNVKFNVNCKTVNTNCTFYDKANIISINDSDLSLDVKLDDIYDYDIMNANISKEILNVNDDVVFTYYDKYLNQTTQLAKVVSNQSKNSSSIYVSYVEETVIDNITHLTTTIKALPVSEVFKIVPRINT